MEKKILIILGVYIQTILNPVKNLGLTAGLRYDNHNIYGNVFNYRLAAVYRISENIYSKIMYGTSFKAPSSVQLYTNYILTGGVIGNPDLKPEKAKTIEAALNARLTKNLNLNFNLFYNKIKDKVELLLPSGGASNIKPDNIADITSAGVESELNFIIKNLQFYFISPLSTFNALQEKK